jgi:hypothetical protein
MCRWIGDQVRPGCRAAGTQARHVGHACTLIVRHARQGCASFWTSVRTVRHFRMHLLTALGVGIAAGTAAYFAGPWLAAAVSATGGFATTLAVQARVWLRHTFNVTAAPHACSEG